MKNVNVVVKSQLTKSNGKLLIVDDPDIVIKSASTNVEFDNLFGGKQPQFSKVGHHTLYHLFVVYEIIYLSCLSIYLSIFNLDYP